MTSRSNNSDRHVALDDVSGPQTSSRRHPRGWSRFAVIGTVSLALLLTACANSDDDDSEATTAAATEAPQTGGTGAAATDAPSGASGTATFTTADPGAQPEDFTLDAQIDSC